MANNPPVLVDAATGRPLLSAHDAERDVLLATIAKLRKSNLDLLDMRNAATRENDAWREWAGDVIERGDDRNGGDAEPRATPEDLRTAYHAGMGLGMRAAKPTEREQIIAVIASMLERGML